MSEIIPLNRVERIWNSLRDREYRRAFAESHVGGFLAAQISVLRRSRGWTQRALASAAGKTQPQISAWESSCENANIKTLQRLAEAFDVALIVKFVSFSELAREVSVMVPDRIIPPYESDYPSVLTNYSTGNIGAPLNKLRPINTFAGKPHYTNLSTSVKIYDRIYS